MVKLWRIYLSFTTALMLTMEFNDRGFFLEELFASDSIIVLLITISLYLISKKNCEQIMHVKSFVLLSFLGAVLWLTGESFIIDNTTTHITNSWGQVFKSVIYLVGATNLLYRLICIFCFLLIWEGPIFADDSAIGIFLEAYKRHIFLYTFICLTLIYGLFNLVVYPGIIVPDTYQELKMYYGIRTFTSHHPPCYTLLVGMFCDIGVKIFGNINRGIFLYNLLIVLFYSLIIAYSALMLKTYKTPNWVYILYGIILVMTPFFSAYVVMIVKDRIYSIFMLLFVCQMIKIILNPKEFVDKVYNYILLFSSIFVVYLMRHNGKYVLITSGGAVLIYYLYKLFKKNFNTIIVAKLIMIFSVSFTVSIATDIIANASYVEEEGSIIEAFSFPLQQTARTVLVHGEEISEEEKQVIDRLVIYSELDERYNPMLSDAVKESIRNEPSLKILRDYIVTWIKMFFKYPGTYISATLNQNYIFFGPFNSFGFLYDKDERLIGNEFGISGVDHFPVAHIILNYYMYILQYIPIVGFLHQPDIYLLLLLTLVTLAIVQRKKFFLLICLPVFLNAVIVVLAPAASVRYELPVIYPIPMLIGAFIYIRRQT